MGLRWEAASSLPGLALGYRPDGVQVGRVRKWRNGYEAHYDPDGLERPPAKPMGAVVDETRWRLGDWSSVDQAMRAVDQHHQLLTVAAQLAEGDA